MTQLYRRKLSITVDTIRFEGVAGETLDAVFNVEKSIKPEPNLCELIIYNLTPDNRSQLLELQTPTVRIEAGYVDAMSLLYIGQVRRTVIERDGADIITRLETADSEKAFKSARVNIPLGPQTPIATALRGIVRSLGVKEGNIAQVVNDLKFKGVGSFFSQGTVLSGASSRVMSDFARSAGLDWSIQDGQIQLVNRNQALKGTAVFLSSSSGLVGTPSLDAEGKLSCVSLLQPDIIPGRFLVLESENVSGNFRVERVRYSGDTSGQDWYAIIEAKSL